MKVAFIDRDGVINEDVGYLHKWVDFKYKSSVKAALKKLKDFDYQLIIVTNQSGISRGLYTENDFKVLNDKMIEDLKNSEINLLDVFYCPHYVGGKIKKYAVDCECRKPKPGLFLKASAKYRVDFSKSVMFGDQRSDIEAAMAAGITHRFLIGSKSAVRNSSKTFLSLKEAVDCFLHFSEESKNV